MAHIVNFKNPISNGAYILVEVSFYIINISVSNKDSTYVTYRRKQIDKNIGVQCKRRLEFLKVVDVIQDI